MLPPRRHPPCLDVSEAATGGVLEKKGALRNFAELRRKDLWQSLFFNKVAGLRPVVLLKKRLWHRFCCVNFAKFLRTPSLQNTSRRLFLTFERVLNTPLLNVK